MGSYDSDYASAHYTAFTLRIQYTYVLRSLSPGKKSLLSLRGRREKRPRRDESSGRRVARQPCAYPDDTAVNIDERTSREQYVVGDVRLDNLSHAVFRRYQGDHNTVCDTRDGLSGKCDDALSQRELSATDRGGHPRRVRLTRCRGFEEGEPVLPVARPDEYPRMRPVGECDTRITRFSDGRRVRDDGAEPSDHDAETEERGAFGTARIQTHEARRDFFHRVRDLIGLLHDDRLFLGDDGRCGLAAGGDLLDRTLDHAVDGLRHDGRRLIHERNSHDTRRNGSDERYEERQEYDLGL